MRFALILIWLTVVVCFALSPVEVKAHLHSMGKFHDFYHWTAFIVTTVLLAWDARSVAARAAWCLVAVGIAFLTELLEFLRFHNPYEWHDVYIDCIGIVTGIAVLVGAGLFTRARHAEYSRR